MKMIHFLPDSKYATAQPGEILRKSLEQLTDILQKFGVEEMTIQENYQHYTLKNSLFNDYPVMQDFCQCIEQMHKDIVKTA